MIPPLSAAPGERAGQASRGAVGYVWGTPSARSRLKPVRGVTVASAG